jgi:hypothetical protein
MVHPALVPLGTCVSGLAVVDIALPLPVTNVTVSELLFTIETICNDHT